jgi:hypothetical protein
MQYAPPIENVSPPIHRMAEGQWDRPQPYSGRLLYGYLPKSRGDWRESLSGLFPLEAPSKILNSRIDL